jgi:hypothetical protein
MKIGAREIAVYDIAYFSAVYLFFFAISIFFYLLYFHVLRSYQWTGEAPVQWSNLIYFGHSFEFSKKPLYKLYAEMKEKHKKNVLDVLGLLIGGQRFFFIINPLAIEQLFQPNGSLSLSDPYKDALLLNFFNMNPNVIQNRMVDFSLLRKCSMKYLLQDQISLESYFQLILTRSKRLFVQLITKPFQTALERMFPKEENEESNEIGSSFSKLLMPSIGIEMKLLDFLNSFFFQLNFHVLFHSKIPLPPKKLEQLSQQFQKYQKVLPLTLGGINIKYFKDSHKAMESLLSVFSEELTKSSAEENEEDGTENESENEMMTIRQNYFKELLEKKTGANIKDLNAKELSKYQLYFLWQSVQNEVPLMFWLIYYILSSPLSSQILTQLQKEISKELQTHDEQFYEEYFLNETSSSNNNNSSEEQQKEKEKENQQKKKKGNNSKKEKKGKEELPLNQFNRLLFLDACITETIRLSSGEMNMKIILSDKTSFQFPSSDSSSSSSQSYSFRKGDRVGFAPSLFHYDEELFPQPEVFNPFRWFQEKKSFDENFATAVEGKVKVEKNGKEINRSAVVSIFSSSLPD